MIVVAFYTPEYEKEIVRLENSCKKFNIELETRQYESRNKWEENCSMKSEFLLEMLNTLDDNIFYVDADAEFQREPEWEELEKYDEMGVVYHYWYYKTQLITELLSGSIYLPNNPQTIEIVEAWIEEQQKDRNIWDQKTLQKVVETYYNDSVFIMDKKWCYVADYMQVENPIIQHWQASRRLKGEINK